MQTNTPLPPAAPIASTPSRLPLPPADTGAARRPRAVRAAAFAAVLGGALAGSASGQVDTNAPPVGGATPAPATQPTTGAEKDAKGLPEAPNPDAVRISITPYLWAAGVDGQVSNYGLTTSFDVGFDDVLKNLDFAFMIHAEVAWRRAFLFGDYEYIDLSTTVDIDEPLLTRADVPRLLGAIEANDPSFGSSQFSQALQQASGNMDQIRALLPTIRSEIRQALQQLTPEERLILARLARDRASNRVEQAKLAFGQKEARVQAAILAALSALKPGPEVQTLDSSMTLNIAEFGGGYRLIEWEMGRPLSEQHLLDGMGTPTRATSSLLFPVMKLDFLAGARYYNMGYSSTVTFTPDAFNILPTIVTTNERYEWVDAIVGGRIAMAFNDQWRIWCRGDVGGFQPSSNYSWCVQGGVEWAPCSWMRVAAGYRTLDILYKATGQPQGFEFNGALSGPFLGVSFVF